MNNTKKILTGVLALSMTASLAACSDGETTTGGNGGGADATTTQETTTTTAMTVAVNEEGLKEGEITIIVPTAATNPHACFEQLRILF